MLGGMLTVGGGDAGPEADELVVGHRMAGDGNLDVDPNLDILEGNVVGIMRWLEGEVNDVAFCGRAFEHKDGIGRDAGLKAWEGFHDGDKEEDVSVS